MPSIIATMRMRMRNKNIVVFPLIVVFINIIILLHVWIPKAVKEKVVLIRECPLEANKVQQLFNNITQVRLVNIEKGQAANKCLSKQSIDDIKLHRDLYEADHRDTMFSSSLEVDPASGVERRHAGRKRKHSHFTLRHD